MVDLSIVIAGAAGQGVQTVEEFLVGILKMSGYHVFATKEYESRVRGGINSTELRIATQRVAAFVDRIDVLVTFHISAIKHLQKRITEETIIIANESDLDEEQIKNPEKTFKLPINDAAIEIGDKIYANVVAVGVIASLFGVDSEIAANFIREKFGKKGEEVINNNINAFNKGCELGSDLPSICQGACSMEKTGNVEDEILIDGATAVGLGAIAGGCNFIAAYPMSPSTGLLTFLAHQAADFGIVVDQAEDEIAAINKVIAAWYTGARGIASSSGGGFALMIEGLSLSAMLETPLVIHLSQRPAPATGLPTRTGQEDLNFALYAGHGEFPRMIFAPGNLQEAFYYTQKAFNLADKYQIPIFILTDQYFVDSYYNIPNLDLTDITVEKAIIETDDAYLRYKYTENGISPRGIPGLGTGFVRVDSDEHNERGDITEDLDFTRTEMVKKRVYKKAIAIMEDVEEPLLVGTNEYRILVLCWGSNFHVVAEALARINREDVAMLHFHQVYPLHPNVNETLTKAEKVLIIENNATGQLADLIKLRANYEIPMKHRLLKFSGAPFSVEEVQQFIINQFE